MLNGKTVHVGLDLALVLKDCLGYLGVHLLLDLRHFIRD
jgi:hypothetical protein